jgi:hypothetical protein
MDLPILVPFERKLFEILNYSVWYAVYVNLIFFCLFLTNVQSKRTTRAEPDDHLWSADHSLRNAALDGRSQWLLGLRRRSTAARLLRSWVRIQPRTWMFDCCECCVLSGRGLCDELITRPRGVLPTVARRCVWWRNLVWRGGHEKRAEPLGKACSKNQLSNLGQIKITC